MKEKRLLCFQATHINSLGMWSSSVVIKNTVNEALKNWELLAEVWYHGVINKAYTIVFIVEMFSIFVCEHYEVLPFSSGIVFPVL